MASLLSCRPMTCAVVLPGPWSTQYRWRGDHYSVVDEAEFYVDVAINVLDDILACLEDYGPIENFEATIGIAYDSINALAKDIIADEFTFLCRGSAPYCTDRDWDGNGDTVQYTCHHEEDVAVAERVLALFDFDAAVNEFQSAWTREACSSLNFDEEVARAIGAVPVAYAAIKIH